MAVPTTYTGWISYIKSWLDVDDLSDVQIGYSLDVAQKRINDEIESMWLESGGSHAWPVSPQLLSIQGYFPDFNRIRLVITDATSQPLKSASINEYYSYLSTGYNSNVIALDSAAYGDLPQFYTIESAGLYIWPAPVSGSIVSIRYYKTVPLLGSVVSGLTIDTNEISTYHWNLLLMAACKEASQFITEDERVPMWEQNYQNLLAAANLNSKRGKLGSTPLSREIPNMGLNW